MRKRIGISIFMLCVFLQISAQSSSLDLVLGVGASVYQGDLSPHFFGSTNKADFGFQAGVNYSFHPSVSFRFNYAFASLADDEQSYASYHQYRNFAFKTSVNELSAQVVFTPNQGGNLAERTRLTPYFFAGVGIGFLSIQRDWSKFNRYAGWQEWVIPGLMADSMTALPTSTLTLPVGLGLRYQFGENVSLYAEVNKRLVKTEYLDGFSQAANPRKKDAFSTLIIGLVFPLANKGGGRGGYGCPINVY